jgi:hypothetical protein
MSLVGLDLNSSRARAVGGAAAQQVALMRLDGDRADLPLAVSLEGKLPVVGHAGLALTRARPHLACLDYLPAVGLDRVWAAGAHRLDADRAVELTFAALARPLGRSAGVACVVPAYLDEAQLVQVMRLAEKCKLPLLGSISSSLAAALGVPGLATRPEPGLILVVDLDGHALTWSVVERGGGQVRQRMVQPSTHLGRGVWMRKLLDGAAHRCVRQSRRDPRDTAEAEQSLYEQLLAALDQGVPRLAQLHVQGVGWFYHLMLNGDELTGMVTPLLRQALADLDAILATTDAVGPLDAVVVTHPAAGLPGLVSLLEARLPARPPAAVPADEDGDYGDSLLRAAEATESPVHVLPPDTPACVAHELAARVHHGDFPRGHLDVVVLPQGEAPRPRDGGPARVSFRGREHVLTDLAFSLGRDPACDLVFESELYPHVSARHAEIVFDRRAYMLCDRSRHGTLLNDRPVRQAALHSGDWIRLGPRGPVLRFLGEPGRP